MQIIPIAEANAPSKTGIILSAGPGPLPTASTPAVASRPTLIQLTATEQASATSIVESILRLGVTGSPLYEQLATLLRSDMNTLAVAGLTPREVNPWFTSNLSSLAGDPSRVICDPSAYAAALEGAIIRCGGVPDRVASAVASGAFDENSIITIAGPTAAGSFQIATLGSSLDPVLGWLYRVLPNNVLRGSAIIGVDYSACVIGGPALEFQITDITKSAYLFVPYSAPRVQNTSVQSLVAGGPGIQLSMTSSDAQVATDKVLSVTSQSDVSFVGQVVSGTNIVVQCYPVILDIDRWFAFRRLLFHNQLHLIGDALIADASKVFNS